MRIEKIAVQVPSLLLTNEELFDRIRTCNKNASPEIVEAYIRQLSHMLTKTGSHTRHVREPGEKALDLILSATEQALTQARVDRRDLDLLIYCGVSRGFLEPAMGYFVSDALGISCECFDVLDACLSWVRSLHLAYRLLGSNRYRTVLIVNGEFNFYESGYPELLRIRPDSQQLRYTFPAFTIGEAATATVLTHSDAHWNFAFRADASKAGLCTIPLPGYEGFAKSAENLALNGVHRFMSFGMELSASALEGIVQFIVDTYADKDVYDIWFPHLASSEMCRVAEERLKLHGKVYSDGFPRFGNLVSASIPASMALAEDRQQLQRGQRVVLCPASAGMGFGLADFVY